MAMGKQDNGDVESCVNEALKGQDDEGMQQGSLKEK